MTFAERFRSIQERTSRLRNVPQEVDPALTSAVSEIDRKREESDLNLVKTCIEADEALTNIISQKKSNMQRKEVIMQSLLYLRSFLRPLALFRSTRPRSRTT